jgi:hypothetical protein
MEFTDEKAYLFLILLLKRMKGRRFKEKMQNANISAGGWRRGLVFHLG